MWFTGPQQNLASSHQLSPAAAAAALQQLSQEASAKHRLPLLLSVQHLKDL